MTDFRQKYGPWALVTGASAGLGESFARQLAARGLNLVLVARRVDRLEALGRELAEAHGVDFRAVGADLDSEDFLPALVAATQDLEVGLLVNNAGFTNSGEFLDNELAAEARLVNVNCRAATLLAHHFGQGMRERRRGGIIFSASIAGFSAIPFWATYAASKSYDLLLSEALSAELKKYNIDVLALCPGTTRTEFADYQGIMANLLVMESGPVVRGALDRLGRRRVYIAGWHNWFTTMLSRLFPRRVYSAVAGKLIRDMVDH